MKCLQSSHPISLLTRSFVHNRNPTNVVGNAMAMTAIIMVGVCCFLKSLKCGVRPCGGDKAPIFA